jgi:hypothetical protein
LGSLSAQAHPQSSREAEQGPVLGQIHSQSLTEANDSQTCIRTSFPRSITRTRA